MASMFSVFLKKAIQNTAKKTKLQLRFGDRHVNRKLGLFYSLLPRHENPFI